MPEKENEMKITTSIGEIQANRPDPTITDIGVVLYKQRMTPQYAVDALVEGYAVLIVDFYSSGLAVLNELKQYISGKYTDQSFQGQREARAAFRELSQKLLLKISDHKILVRKSPEIGWLKILYPELTVFLLPFSQVQGLNSAWQWYEKGIFIPVLRKKIHPWYGTYFPTRFEHLELFENWLKEYKGKKESAIDVGIGSGVLTFQMLKHGFRNICGTDNNPNAIIGMDEYAERNQISSKISMSHGDLLTGCESSADLIVFNPPWLPASYNPGGIDSAIYYDEDLFSRFFSEASKHLNEGGRVVVIFSNLAQITNHETVHPIENELATGKRFIKERLIEKQVRAASKKTRRNLERRNDEKVELWVLKPSNANSTSTS